MQTQALRLSPSGLDRARKLFRVFEILAGDELEQLLPLLHAAVDSAEVIPARTPRTRGKRPHLALVK